MRASSELLTPHPSDTRPGPNQCPVGLHRLPGDVALCLGQDAVHVRRHLRVTQTGDGRSRTGRGRTGKSGAGLLGNGVTRGLGGGLTALAWWTKMKTTKKMV